MTASYQLQGLGPQEFEHLVNALALQVLGAGATGFGPGPDGGRDGYFVGEAPYPSNTERWSGTWIIQSKFQVGGADSSKWLLAQLKSELDLFAKSSSTRRWPDNYIIATNIEPSGAPRTGLYDRCRDLVRKRRKKLAPRFDIWGGRKILDLLSMYPGVAEQYAHLLTTGHALTVFMRTFLGSSEVAERITTHLIVNGLEEHCRTKLEQAGDTSDDTAGVHLFFTDIPFKHGDAGEPQMVLATMMRASANTHRPYKHIPSSKEWLLWQRQPERARIWFLKGGPGQGKSTTSQYYCQVQRAALLLATEKPLATPRIMELARSIQQRAQQEEHWPASPRIPVHVELKEYAAWCGRQSTDSSCSVLSYVASRLSRETGETVTASALRKLFEQQRWAFVFDGLDEVSGDIKDKIASEIAKFVRDTFSKTDSFVICSSRPQGYSGQFDSVDPCTIELSALTPALALTCAEPVLRYRRGKKEADDALARLTTAIAAPSVRELMTTPLQAHIMAVIVRSGQRPPERKWILYSRFFSVILAREANRDLHDAAVARLLQQDERLIRVVHSRVGIALHTYAERATGAQADLPRDEFLRLVAGAVHAAKEEVEAAATIDAVKKASEERLVLISTPTDKSKLRYDIRQLQEFFAAEFLHDGVAATELESRLKLFIGDAHWREVVHFLLSALVEGNKRPELALAVQVLAELDNGHESFPQTVARRLARGALIAARLLEDGVLEADKSIRNMFRAVVEPLAVTPRPHDVVSLLAIEGTASRSWIADLMASRLMELSLDKAVGAATLVFHLLPASHPQFTSVRARFAESDGRIVAAVVTFTPYPHHLGEWQALLLAEKLVDPRWTSSLARILRSYYTRQPPSSKVDVLTEAITRMYGTAVRDTMLFHLSRTDSTIVKQENFGPLKLVFFGSSEGGDLGKLLRAFPKSGAHGSLLDVLRAALAYSVAPSRPAFCALLAAANHSRDTLDWLPEHLISNAPLPPASGESLESYAGRVTWMSDAQFAALCGSANSHRFRFEFSGKEAMKAADFARLIETRPRLAITVWCYELEPRKQASWEAPIADMVLSMLCADPDLLLAYFPAVGKLVHHQKGTALRHAIMALSSRASEVERSVWRQGINPYPLVVPDEAPVVCLVVAHFASILNVLHRDYYFFGEEGDSRKRALVQAAREYIAELSTLLDLANDSAADAAVRASAAILAALHSETPQLLLKYETIVLAAAANDSFVGAATIAVLGLLTSESDLALSAMIVRLLAIVPDQGRWESVWDNTIRRLRERSLAPVTEANVLHKWLQAQH